jgi:predicted permease
MQLRNFFRRWIDSFRGDVRFALRHFARTPLTTVTIIVVLSIGIGVQAGVFSLIQAMTMRPAPGVPRDDALVAIRGKERLNAGGRWRSRTFSSLELRDFAGQRDVFASVVGWVRYSVALDAGDGDGREAQVQFVTGGFFPTIGVRPILGAGLPLDDRLEANDAQLVAVIGHTLWRDSFASAPDVVGRTIRVNDVPIRVVGVAPPRFNGAVPIGGTRTLWMPLSARATILRTTADASPSDDAATLTTAARLAPGVTLPRANAVVAVIGAGAGGQAPRADGVTRAADVVALRGDIGLYADTEVALTSAAWESLALLILLITCTNVSALVVGAAVTRRQEIAIRLSLGASRSRVMRQLLTESSLLALAGGTLGLLVYWWIARLLTVELPNTDIVPDLMTVAITLCFALGTGILFGLSPALHATRRGAADALKNTAVGATSRSRLQRTLVAAQIALTQPLLLGLGVTMAIVLQDRNHAASADVADRVISVAFNLSNRNQFSDGQLEDLLRSDAYKIQAARVDSALQRVAALPGVVGIVRSRLGYSTMDLEVVSEDRGTLPRASMPIEVRVESQGPEYFALLDIPIVRGRALVTTDTAGVEIPLVIGSDLARELWGGEDVIGRRFDAMGTPRRYVVAGVYDSRQGLARGSQPVIYAPISAEPAVSYLIRTAGPGAGMIGQVRSIIRTEIPQIPIGVLTTLGEAYRVERAEVLTASGAAGGSGLLALLLASIGLHGVVALALGQRRREIGVRVALGARPQQVVRMLFGSGLRLSLAGLVLGLPLSAVALQVVQTQLQLPDLNIPLVGAAIALLVIGVASVATWFPARRAASVDPVIALRAD